MNMPLFFGIITILAAIYIWIGKQASKGLQTEEDYYLMGRGLTYFPLFLTFLATQLGGGTLLGAAQEAHTKGWMVLFYPLGTCLGFLALGLGFGGKLRALNIATVAEVFEKVYRSRLQRSIGSGLSIIALFLILVAQGIAARLFFTAMGVEHPAIFCLFWSTLVAYTVMGGLKAVVNTDILQALFIIGTLIIAVLSIDGSGVNPSAITLPSDAIAAVEIPWCSWLFMPFLFMLIEQDMGQRCFAAKNTKVIFSSCISAGVALLVCSSVAIYFGVVAKESAMEIPAGASVLIESIKRLTNPTVTTLVMVAIFLAIISTADSLLCSISSNISYDFLSSSGSSAKEQTRKARVMTLIVGIAALGLTYLFDNVVSVLIIAYELSVSILVIPIVGAILDNKPSRDGAYLAMILGLAGFIGFRLFDTALPKEVLTISLSTSGYLIGKKVFSNKRLTEEYIEVQG